jgi:hypothetical protein
VAAAWAAVSLMLGRVQENRAARLNLAPAPGE